MIYPIAVVVPASDDETVIREAVANLLERYRVIAEGRLVSGTWDEWTIGGAWDGAITGNGPEANEVVCEECSEGQRGIWTSPSDPTRTFQCTPCWGAGRIRSLSDYRACSLSNNCCPVADRSTSFYPVAIVTPGPQWHSLQMCIFPDDDEPLELEKQRQITERALAPYAEGHLIVGIECVY